MNKIKYILVFIMTGCCVALSASPPKQSNLKKIISTYYAPNNFDDLLNIITKDSSIHNINSKLKGEFNKKLSENKIKKVDFDVVNTVYGKDLLLVLIEFKSSLELKYFAFILEEGKWVIIVADKLFDKDSYWSYFETLFLKKKKTREIKKEIGQKYKQEQSKNILKMLDGMLDGKK